MRIFKRLLAFVLINLLVLGLVSLVLHQEFTMDMLMEEAEFQNADAVILGQSLPQTGLDPSLFHREGETVFNFSRGAISMECLPVLLKEVHRSQPLKTVYLNLDPTYWSETDWISELSGSVDNDVVALFYRSLSHISSPSYLWKVLDRQPFGNILFPYSLDSTTVRDLPRTLPRKFHTPAEKSREDYISDMRSRNQTTEEYEYRGSGFMYGIRSNVEAWAIEEYSPLPDTPPHPIFDAGKVPQGTLDAFREIADYCRDQGLELICFTTAQSPEILLRSDYGTVHDFYAGLCSDHQVPYYDLNYLKPAYLPRSITDYVDLDGHMLGALAQAQSLLFLEILESPHPETYFCPDYDSLLSEIRSARG